MAYPYTATSISCMLPTVIGGALLLATVSCAGDRHSRSSRSQTERTDTVTNPDSRPAHASHPLDFKLYMERSGSMVSFDSQNSKGEFKGIVSTLLNRFPSVTSNDSTSVYIVNDNIYPYEGSVKNFLSQRDFFSSTKEIGNPAYTDFARIFEMILDDTKKYQVSALVTDLIYSVNGQESVSASKLLNDAYSLTHNAFKGKTSTSVILVQFEADYNGPYYPYNSPNQGVEYHGDRPFYVLLFASKDSMAELYEAQEYKAFTNFSTLSGYENMFCFTSLKFTPAFSIVPDYEHEGRYRKDRDHHSGVKGINEAQLSQDGRISIPIALDLSSIPLSNSYKKNKDYYEIISGTGFKVKSVDAIDDIDNAAAVTKQLPSATHLLTIEATERPQNESVAIKLAYRLPGWVSKTSSADDSNLKADNFEDTTFGLEEVMKGMFAAYVPDGSTSFLFDIKIDIKKK